MDGIGQQGFHGAKLALFVGARLVVIERDDVPQIVWPGYIDLPGGGREGDESPESCVLRETREELGLVLREADLTWRRCYDVPNRAWFFAAHGPDAWADQIVFGDEGRAWHLMTPDAFMASERAIPHFRHRVREYLASLQ